jgi:hypothetical protein
MTTSNRIDARPDDITIELNTSEDILREVRPGDFVKKPAWGSYYRVINFRPAEFSNNILMFVCDTMGYEVSYNITGYTKVTWFKKVDELKYVPTQEGDRDNDI